MKLKFRSILLTSILAIAGIFGVSSVLVNKQIEETPVSEVKADYSSTIRVYVDLDWNDINYVRLGTDQATGNAVLSSSNAKYNQSLGKYVRDISSSSTYDKMGFFFSQGGQWWQYQYDGGYVWISGGFRPGYEYQLKSVGYIRDEGGNKLFACTPYEIGEITDNVSNPTVYFVNGYSWASPSVHYWGGTATVDYPGSAMSLTTAKIHCKVGESWFDIGIWKYTISGSVAYVQFNEGDDKEKTGDLRPENGKIYWFGASAETFGDVASYLVSFMNSMGSHTYEGESYTNSICSFTSSQATSFVSGYESLCESEDQDIIDSITQSTITTYSVPVTSPSSTSDIAIPTLIEQVRKNTSNGYYGAIRDFSPLAIFSDKDNVSTIIIIVASSVALLSVTALSILVIKKRKQKEE